MLEKIRRLMGNTAEEPTPQDAFRQLNSVAPLKSRPKGDSESGNSKQTTFVCREAVLNRKERIAGYEFALGRELQSRMLEKSVLIRRVYDDAMLRNLAPLGISSLLGERFALIRLSVFSLKNPLLKSYANSNTFIMITPGVISETGLAEVRGNLRHLGDNSIKHGWTLDRPRPELAEFLQEADIIEIEAATLDGIQIKSMCQEFRSAKGGKKLIASALQTSDDFNLCFNCGFDYFMGPFVSSRENWHPAKSEINRLRVFEALNMIRTGAEFDAISDCLRTDPVLTYKLLRYINSPGIGLQQKINELSQALLILGRDRFYRWLSLLLFDFNQPGYRELVLNEQALTRARFMEMLAGQGRVPAAADQLFITGLFSLLDVMMEQPLNDILKKVSLPEAVSSALKGEPGAMRDALLLGVTVETNDQEAMATAAEQCGLDAATVSGLMIEALAWSQQLISASEQT
jgi:EAL and modified HD-GYP domain-containing signal transduction protein